MLFWMPLLRLSGAFGCLRVPVGGLLGTFGDSWGPFGYFLVPFYIVGNLFGAFGNLRVPFELPLGSLGPFLVVRMFIFAVQVLFVMILFIYLC